MGAILFKLLSKLPGLLNWLQNLQSARVAELERRITAYQKNAEDDARRIAGLRQQCRQIEEERLATQRQVASILQRASEAETRVKRLEADLAEKQTEIDRLSAADVWDARIGTSSRTATQD